VRIEWRYRRSINSDTWVAEELVFTTPYSFSVPTRRYFKTKEEAVQYAARKNLEIWQREQELRHDNEGRV